MPSRRRLADARASRRLLLAAERQVDTAVLAAIDEWLTALRFAILRDLGGTAVTAAAYPHAPFVLDQAAQASWNTWRRALDRQVLPSVAIVFGEAFQQARRRDPLNSYRYQQQYLEDVSDRLKIWPEGAFEDIRPELMEALAEGESIDDIRDRIGRVLNIDAKTRAIRAVIHEVEQRLDDPDLPANARQVLKARRRELWEAHDDSLGEWQWKARRIARTEAHGAVLGGKLASAQARQQLDPDVKLYKRWLATDDTRTRATHRVADGQVVPLGQKFRIGGFLLDHPADAITIAPHEVINCRCDLLIYDDDELQDELQGPDGSIGQIRPGGVRIGPDDPDDADRAIAAVAADEQRALPRLGRRGEDHGQEQPGDQERVELTDAREKLPPPDRVAIGHAGTNLSKLSDDQLLDEMQRANDTSNDALWDAADAEWERRHDDERSARDPDSDGGEQDFADWLDAEAQWRDDADRWLTAEQEWKADVHAWLDAETRWRSDVADWVAAENDWLVDPLPGLKRKVITRDLTTPTGFQLEFNADVLDVNPQFNNAVKWQINCQRVVQALELRRRGYDVTAQPNDGTVSRFSAPMTYQQYQAMKSQGGNVDHYGRLWRRRDGTVPEFVKSGGKSATVAAISKQPVGARGWLRVAWKGGGAHVFSWEILTQNGGKTLRLIDGQDTTFDAFGYLDNAKPGSILWLRVDDLMPTDDVRPMVQ